MPNINDSILRQLDALNNWLGDVYSEETDYSTLLNDAGLSESEVQQLKQEYLSEFLEAVQSLLKNYINTPTEARNNMVMIQHYGLDDGTPQSFHVIGNSVGVCGERIWQLVTKRLNFYRDPVQQAKFKDDFAAIGRRILNNENSGEK